ncbi:hypothetical protein SSTU70S_04140 [Stutzerimonas stutzeri]
MAVAQRIAEIGAEIVTTADEAGRLPPVAHRDAHAVDIQQVDDRGLGAGQQRLEFAVDASQRLIVAGEQTVADIAVVGQHERQQALLLQHRAQQRALQRCIVLAALVEGSIGLVAAMRAGQPQRNAHQQCRQQGEKPRFTALTATQDGLAECGFAHRGSAPGRRSGVGAHSAPNSAQASNRMCGVSHKHDVQ